LCERYTIAALLVLHRQQFPVCRRSHRRAQCVGRRLIVEEHHNVEKLQVTVAQQQKQIEALTAGLQKVSARLEVSKPAPQVVNNRKTANNHSLALRLKNRTVGCLG
jgi:methionyl-tRNA formyltransferase